MEYRSDGRRCSQVCDLCSPSYEQHRFSDRQVVLQRGREQAKFLMKKEWFFFPLGWVFRSMGGIPIDRSRNQSMTEQMAAEFASHDYFRVAITPEGTRKRVDEWKRGFYYIALKARVPIQLGYIDYGRKEVGIMSTFWPTGDADADIHYIRSCYKGIRGRHGEKFGEIEGKTTIGKRKIDG